MDLDACIIKPKDEKFLAIIPSPLEVQLNGLIREAEAKARIYSKLFGVNLQPILDYAYCAAQGASEPGYRTMIEGVIDRFELNYNRIRLLEGNSKNYPPFVAISMIIPKLKEALNEQELYEKLEEGLTAIKVLGSACLSDVRQLAERIRKFEGMEDYQVKIKSPEGPIEVIA